MMTNRAQQLIRMSPLAYAVATGDGPYAELTSASGKKEVISYSLNNCNRLLPDLIRVHNAYLVNPACVAQWVFSPSVSRQPSYVVLQSGECIPIARRKAKAIRNQIQPSPVNKPQHDN